MASRLNGRNPPRPHLRDSIEKRPNLRSSVDLTKEDTWRRQSSRKVGSTVSVSFTVPPDIDAEIERLALLFNCSRSRIVRQAIIMFGAENE